MQDVPCPNAQWKHPASSGSLAMGNEYRPIPSVSPSQRFPSQAVALVWPHTGINENGRNGGKRLRRYRKVARLFIKLDHVFAMALSGEHLD
jgi:hypothetical protein